MRNFYKSLMNVLMLTLAMLLTLYPIFEASASRYFPVVIDASASEASLPSRPAANWSDRMPRTAFPMMQPNQTFATRSHFSFSYPILLPVFEPPAAPRQASRPAVPPPMPVKLAPAAPPDPYKPYVTTAYYLNVREEDNNESEILRVVEKGDVLKVRSKTDNGWLALYDGGFVHGAYAQPKEKQPHDLVTLTLAPAPKDAGEPSKSSIESSKLSKLSYPSKPSKPSKPTSTVQSDSGLTVEHIGEIMQGTALKDESLASAILEIEDEYGINAYFTIAVMKLESGNGKSRLAKSKNNLFGLNATGGSNSQAYAFDTKEDSVRKFGQLISKYYVDKGYTTIEKVAGKYCPANDDWPKLVKQIMRSDHGKLADYV